MRKRSIDTSNGKTIPTKKPENALTNLLSAIRDNPGVTKQVQFADEPIEDGEK